MNPALVPGRASMARATRADIECLVRDATRQVAPGGGFILSPRASPPYEIPLPKQASEGLIHYPIRGRGHGVHPLPSACGDATNPGPTVTTYS